MFETAWISDRDGPGEAVRQLDPVELFLDCLPQFDLVDVAQPRPMMPAIVIADEGA